MHSNNSLQSQWVCRAIFQSLRPLSRNYVLRMLFITSPLSCSDVQKWYQDSSSEAHDNSLHELVAKRIVLYVGTNRDHLIMNRGFREALQFGLSATYEPWTKLNDLKIIIDRNYPAKAVLFEECIHKWNVVLEYLVTANPTLPVPPCMLTYLICSGLVKEVDNFETEGVTEKIQHHRSKYAITSKGYEYMLLDIQSQVMLLLIPKSPDHFSIGLELRLLSINSICTF
jgi:hypothetical protein